MTCVLDLPFEKRWNTWEGIPESSVASQLLSSNGSSLSSPTKTPDFGAQLKYCLFPNVPSQVPKPRFSWKIEKSKKNYGTLFLTSWNTRKRIMIDSVLNCPSDEIKISGWETRYIKKITESHNFLLFWKVLYWHVRELHVFFEIYGCSVLCHSGRSTDEAQVRI